MTTVTLKEAQQRLAELATLVEKGETVTIMVDGKPVAELVAPKLKWGGLDLEAGTKFLRERGLDKVFTYVAPDFDAPLPEDVLIKPLPR